MAGTTWNCSRLGTSSVYTIQPCHFIQSHIRKVYACLAVTCHLHFWQNDRDLLRATAVTRGGTDPEIRVSTENRPWRRKFSRRSCRDSNLRPFSHESGALTTELFLPGKKQKNNNKKHIMKNTSVIKTHMAASHQSSLSCSTRAIQKSLTLIVLMKQFWVFWKKGRRMDN